MKFLEDTIKERIERIDIENVVGDILKDSDCSNNRLVQMSLSHPLLLVIFYVSFFGVFVLPPKP
jgi:hypothetical protein